MATPNILFLFTDMQRADTIGALGNGVIRTPNLDRLVQEGTAFTRCYTPSPVCIPARCCAHYGLYPQRTGLFNNGRMMDDNGASYASVLQQHGYATMAIGKCHFTPDPYAQRGFAQRLVQEECCNNYGRDDYRCYLQSQGLSMVEPHGCRGEMYYIPQPSHLPAAHHPSQWIGDRSIDYIQTNQSPWCLFASFIHPHPPFTPPHPWHKLYRAPLMPLPNVPPDAEALHTHINRKQNRYKYRDQGTDQNLLRNIKAYYYATISFVDYQIGRILDTLAATGQLDNTLIVFTSDHGEYLGDYNCFGKRSMHDASSRVPMLVRYPGRFAGATRCNQPASLVDVMPTLLAAADIDSTALQLDGVDLADLAKGNCDRQYVYSQWGDGQTGIYMIASERWKYIFSAGDHKEILFDNSHDPEERRNLAGLALVRGEKQQLRQALLAYLDSAGASDAVERNGDQLTWKAYPRLEQSYLDDPDAGLLLQDETASLFRGFPAYQ